MSQLVDFTSRSGFSLRHFAYPVGSLGEIPAEERWQYQYLSLDTLRCPYDTAPPEPEGWERFWSGYWRMKEVHASSDRQSDVSVHASSLILHEADVEKDCLLSILTSIQKKQITAFELGAGYGAISLALAGAINHRIVDTAVQSCFLLAVEGEPSHYLWCKKHFLMQGIRGIVVHGAVTEQDGAVGFHAGDADTSYGQSIGGNFKVPAYSVDSLRSQYAIDFVDIIHMDVQGAECSVILGMKESILNRKIGYLVIGTHESNAELRNMSLIQDHFNLLLDIETKNLTTVVPYSDIPRLAYFPTDGLQVYLSKM